MMGEEAADEVIRPAGPTFLLETGTFPARLAERVQALGDEGYAVIDGGLFDDLPGALRRERLLGRSLFREHADVEVERAGPWLVPVGQAADAPERIFSLVGDRPAVVVWSCDAGEPALYRHLRSLNLVQIPVWAAAGASTPPENGVEAPAETVLFRHWDPRVLGALMPVLDAGQFIRIVGPASEIIYWAEDYGGLKRVIADPDWRGRGAGC